MMGVIHSIRRFREMAAPDRLREESSGHKTKTGHSPRQRTNGPDHKLPAMEVAMADKANRPKPCDRQDGRYARPMPIGDVAHSLIRDLAKRVGK